MKAQLQKLDQLWNGGDFFARLCKKFSALVGFGRRRVLSRPAQIRVDGGWKKGRGQCRVVFTFLLRQFSSLSVRNKTIKFN